MNKIYVKIKDGQRFPDFVQLSSTWQENIYVAMVDEDTEKRLRNEFNVVEARPIDLSNAPR